MPLEADHDPIFVYYAPVNKNPGHSGALAGDSQHYISLLVNQVISKENEAYSPLCPGAGGAGIYIDWCITCGKQVSMIITLQDGTSQQIIRDVYRVCCWHKKTNVVKTIPFTVNRCIFLVFKFKV